MFSADAVSESYAMFFAAAVKMVHIELRNLYM